MTDRDPVQDRLSRWFAGEVRRAERDLAARPVTPSLRRRQAARLPLALSVLGLAVAVGAVAILQRPVSDPAQPSTSAPAVTAAASPSATPPTAGISDGIPATMDGEPVLDVRAAERRAREATDASPFLVGGVASPIRDCALIRPITFATCPRLLLTSSDGLADALSTRIVVEDLEVPDGPVVLRVHAFDPREATCGAVDREDCRDALVALAVVWPEPAPGPVAAADVPAEVAGEPVLDAAEALARAAAAIAPDSFLVGGVAERLRARCPFVAGARGETRLLGCKVLGIRSGGALAAITVDRVVFGPGPIVLRVHAGDTSGDECAPAKRDECRAAIVADAIVWSRQQVVGVGFPISIDGQKVLAPGEASELARRAGPMPDTLVAGFIDRSTIVDCVVTQADDAGFGCPDLILTGRPGALTPSGPFGDQLMALRLDAWIPDVARVVARVHTHDPAAARCPAEVRASCEDRVVIDAIVWVDPSEVTAEDVDGRPESIGETRLSRPSEVDRASLRPGEQVAIAGWVAGCTNRGCGRPLLVDMPMSLATALELPARAAVLSGRVVVVVERSATGLDLVSVPWTAGEVIATTPLTLNDVLRILPADELEPSRFGVGLMACTPDGQVFFTKSLDGRPAISTTVILFPNPEARAAYETAPQTSQCFRDGFWAHNLMIQVGLPQAATPEDVAVKQALEARMAELAASGP